MKKRGQIQLSFGMIFSIVIISVTIFVAGYVIMNFLKTKDCVQIGTFYKSLENEINSAWNSQGQSRNFTGNLPSKISWVCFGSINQVPSAANKLQYDYVKQHSFENKNLFFYLPIEACGNSYAAYSLNHAQTSEFFCVPVKAGKAELKISKDPFESLVKLSK